MTQNDEAERPIEVTYNATIRFDSTKVGQSGVDEEEALRVLKQRIRRNPTGAGVFSVLRGSTEADGGEVEDPGEFEAGPLTKSVEESNSHD